jgi:hypothetical protein
MACVGFWLGDTPTPALSAREEMSWMYKLTETKVFWFFFSKKNCLLASSEMVGAAHPTRRWGGGRG